MKLAEWAQLLRLSVLMVIALAGLTCALQLGWSGLEHSFLYVLVASLLLCFGLYMAVYGIDRAEAKRHWRIVLIAVTFGVLCKYLIIVAVAYLLTRNWHYAVFGMAVAQIDPLSVASLNSDPRMSEKTRTILNMWASFDDPMTALATPFILGVAANVANERLSQGKGWGSVLVNTLPFASALLLVGLLTFWRRMSQKDRPAILMHKLDGSEKSKNILITIAGLVAVPMRLYSTAALTGWFVRPRWLAKGRRAEVSTNFALYGSTFLLGILLAGGVDWMGGVILGVATYSSQIVVAWLVMWLAVLTNKKERRGKHRLSKRDTWHLALSQQNGITAIVLALNLEPAISGAVAAVSLAIIVINALNFGANWIFDRLVEPRVNLEA